jgi:hypothetical protein
MADKNLLGAALGDLSPWSVWAAVFKALYGLGLSRAERRVFGKVAGGRKPPRGRVRELWAIVGRRGGKSRMAACVACYIASFVDHSHKLAAGETGYVLVLAASKSQADAVFQYCVGFLTASPLLADQIEAVTADEIRLKGGIVIAVHTNNFRTVRGRTLLACIFDECAFWRDETTAQPDVETYRAVLPALATVCGLLIAISSAYRRVGLLYTKHRDYFGQDNNDVLVVQGGTETFNPTIDRAVIEGARRDDPTAALSEWDAEFRGDLSAFLDDAAIHRGRPMELPPRRDVRYHAFVDASAGRHYAFAICIARASGSSSTWCAGVGPRSIRRVWQRSTPSRRGTMGATQLSATPMRVSGWRAHSGPPVLSIDARR